MTTPVSEEAKNSREAVDDRELALDVELVRDLEADSQREDAVRGGPCIHSYGHKITAVN